jgi:hypothetical protein
MRLEPEKKTAHVWRSTLPRVPPPKKGLKLAGIRLRPDQIKALQLEAIRRAAVRGSMKPDASEVVREAVDAWLAKHRPKS